MQIPDELLVKWKSLRSRGDNEKLNAMLEKPLERQTAITTFARAFSRGYCPDDVFRVLNKFYTSKEADLFSPQKNQS